MATSASIDFSLTARQLVTFALRKLNVVATTESPSADDAARAMEELNLLLKGWAKYPVLWRYKEGSVFATDTGGNQFAYALSTDTHHVFEVRFRNSSTDSVMMFMSRGDWLALPSRTEGYGAPTRYYVDRQRTTTTLNVFPAFSAPTGSVQSYQYTYQRKLEDIDDLDNDIDIRPEWLEVVGYNLASRLTSDFGVTGERAQRIAQTADVLLRQALGDNKEDIPRSQQGVA